MKFIFGSSKIVNIRSSEHDLVDLSNAKESHRLSGSGYEESKKLFWSTLDRVKLKSPDEIIHKILEAHGFIVNIENTLACLDSFSIGLRAKVDEETLKSEKKYIVQSYMYAVNFILPHKKSSGKLLKEFYQEISAYEEELQKMRLIKNLAKKDDKEDKSIDQLRKELSEVRLENATLKSQLTGLSQHNLNLREQFKYQQPEGEQMPENIRLGSVRSVILNERIVSIKMGKSNLTVPLQTCQEIPNPGEDCLVNIEQGVVKNVYFYDNKNKFNKNIATVLNQSEGILKIRDHQRKQWIIEAQSDEEIEKFQQLSRGQIILFRYIKDTIIDIESITKFKVKFIENEIQEEIYKAKKLAVGIKAEKSRKQEKPKSKKYKEAS